MAIIRYPLDHEKHPGERVSRTGTCPHCQQDVEQWAFSLTGNWTEAAERPDTVQWSPVYCATRERAALQGMIG